MENFQKKLNHIKKRNQKVEMDKAWETSFFRKIAIAFLTYFVIVLFFFYAKLPDPFINALVPTMGFLISTLSLPVFKKIWQRYFYKKDQ